MVRGFKFQLLTELLGLGVALEQIGFFNPVTVLDAQSEGSWSQSTQVL